MKSLLGELDGAITGGLDFKTLNKDERSLIEKLDRTFVDLKRKRSDYEGVWQEIARFLCPRRPRFFNDEEHGRRSHDIIDSTATFSLRTLVSGMMSGMTSPARRWLNMITGDYDLAENQEVNAWLYIVTERMMSIYSKSTLYNELPQVYEDLGGFGTGAIGVFEDFDTTIRVQSYPIGTYYIANGPKNTTEVFGREYPMTARKLYHKYIFNERTGERDWSKVSSAVKSALENGHSEQEFLVRHVIEPNRDYDPNNPRSDKKKYLSAYYFPGSAEVTKPLDKSGFDIFPILCPKWTRSGEDDYGTDWPGIVTIGDIKQLQYSQKKFLKALDRMVDPPLQAPSSMRHQWKEPQPGRTVWNTDSTNRDGVRAIYQVQHQVLQVMQMMEETRDRIRKGFYEDIFLMLTTRSGNQPLTATEVNERYEEKLTVLAPVLQQVNLDLLDPLTDITFAHMAKQELLPPIPDALAGRELDVEYISIMSQAQKSIGTGPIDRTLQLAASVSQIYPEITDKIDFDQALDVYAEKTGSPPGIVRGDEEVSTIRQQRAQAQQQQQQAALLDQGSQAAKNLSSASLEGNSALSALVGGAGGG